ncbi:MAG: type II toxin-antitoxin system RelE/ParE family toxin [Polyangiaceae bacterium]|nr:type II toxin-antitoxin system RelE/ParE family toxin [Polyangiaceae bacterium]
MKLELSLRAVREIEACARAWREAHPAAAERFGEELRAAFEQLRAAPRAGVLYPAMRGREHRRVLLRECGQHVYYRVVGADRVRVVAVWGAAPRRAPAR